MSNPLMQNNPNAGAWLNGQQEAPKSAPIVSNDLKHLYGMYCASKDPQAFIKQVMSSNPTLEVMSHGGNMKNQFYAECQRRGINPDAFLAEVEQGLKNR